VSPSVIDVRAGLMRACSICANDLRENEASNVGEVRLLVSDEGPGSPSSHRFWPGVLGGQGLRLLEALVFPLPIPFSALFPLIHNL